MKKLFSFYIIVVITSQAHAQAKNFTDSLKNRIEYLENRVDVLNLDERLNAKVANQTYIEVQKWVWFFSLVWVILIFLARFYLNSLLKQSVQKELELKLANLTNSINLLTTNEETFIKKLDQFENKLKNTMDYFGDEIANTVLDRAKSEKFKGVGLDEKLNLLLSNDLFSLPKEKRIIIIDSLMRSYYADNKYQQMIDLQKKYEKDYELLPETYANAAIAFSNNYELFGRKEDRDTCIESCDKSLMRLPDYGIPYAVKLEVFIIDWFKAFDDTERNQAIDNIKRLFKNIENNNSQAVCFETVQRLDVDKDVAYLNKYIVELERQFPDEVFTIKDRAFIAFYLDKPSNDPLFIKLMTEGINNSIDINGLWIASDYIEAGTSIDAAKLELELEINSYAYIMRTGGNNKYDKGWVYLIPFSRNLAMNYYAMEGTNKGKVIKGIYKFEEDHLLVCLNYITDERPAGFNSNNTNSYTLIRFEKSENLLAAN